MYKMYVHLYYMDEVYNTCILYKYIYTNVPFPSVKTTFLPNIDHLFFFGFKSIYTCSFSFGTKLNSFQFCFNFISYEISTTNQYIYIYIYRLEV